MATRGHKKPRGKFHHGDLRAAAIGVAGVELEAHGYAALTLEGIAKQLGVTRPALYRHFADRKALLQATAQPIFVRFEAALTEAALSTDDPWASLSAVAHAYLAFAVANRGWFRLQFVSPETERPMPDLDAAPARYFPVMLDRLRAIYGDDDPLIEPRYTMLWSFMHGVSMLAAERVFGMPDEQALPLHQATIDVFIESLNG